MKHLMKWSLVVAVLAMLAGRTMGQAFPLPQTAAVYTDASAAYYPYVNFGSRPEIPVGQILSHVYTDPAGNTTSTYAMTFTIHWQAPLVAQSCTLSFWASTPETILTDNVPCTATVDTFSIGTALATANTVTGNFNGVGSQSGMVWAGSFTLHAYHVHVCGIRCAWEAYQTNGSLTVN